MDPQATWDELCTTLRQLKDDPENGKLREEALSCLHAIANWLERGEFPPTVEE
jgi:hypothetical protein